MTSYSQEENIINYDLLPYRRYPENLFNGSDQKYTNVEGNSERYEIEEITVSRSPIGVSGSRRTRQAAKRISVEQPFY